MREKILFFILINAIVLGNSQAEILNFRKSKVKQQEVHSILSIETKETEKNFSVIEKQEFRTEMIPKPNSSVPDREKIVIPLSPPSDPARPKRKQPSQFCRPFNQKLITTVNFTLNPENPHKGVVYSPIEIGSVISSMEGRVVAIDFMDGYYNYVIIEHPNGFFTVYGNLDEVFVAEGQLIKKGEVLGNLMKEKGLYFQVNQGKKILDPISLIKS